MAFVTYLAFCLLENLQRLWIQHKRWIRFAVISHRQERDNLSLTEILHVQRRGPVTRIRRDTDAAASIATLSQRF